MLREEDLIKPYLESLGIEPDKGCSFPSYIECNSGWYKHLVPVFEYINNWNKDHIDPDDKIQVHQIKEKFGGLRFYTSFGTDDLYTLIRKAEEECSNTCEICSEPGKLCGGGWFMTLCEVCNGKNKKAKNEST